MKIYMEYSIVILYSIQTCLSCQPNWIFCYMLDIWKVNICFFRRLRHSIPKGYKDIFCGFYNIKKYWFGYILNGKRKFRLSPYDSYSKVFTNKGVHNSGEQAHLWRTRPFFYVDPKPFWFSHLELDSLIQ